MKVNLMQYTPEADELAFFSARRCYSGKSYDDLESEVYNKDKEDMSIFLQEMVAIGHHSIFEHASFTFHIEGASRITEQQLTRHRLASYSIQSSRYTSRGNFQTVIPDTVIESDEAESYKKGINAVNSLYDSLIEAGVSREDARYFLPQGMATNMVVTMNARQLLHFFKLRLCRRSQWEIQDLANQMYKLAYSVAPAIFENAGPSCVIGSCDEGSMSCGEPLSKEELRG